MIRSPDRSASSLMAHGEPGRGKVRQDGICPAGGRANRSQSGDRAGRRAWLERSDDSEAAGPRQGCREQRRNPADQLPTARGREIFLRDTHDADVEFTNEVLPALLPPQHLSRIPSLARVEVLDPAVELQGHGCFLVPAVHASDETAGSVQLDLQLRARETSL